MGGRQKRKIPKKKVFADKKDDLSIHKGLILWGTRVVIPQVFQKQALEMLHNSHFGKTRMTQLARESIWFPGMDKRIKNIAEACETCAVMGNDPKRTILRPWPEPKNVWQRIHMDLAESDDKSRWLVIVDAKSKWPEVIEMRSTSSQKVIEALKRVFAIHGLPEEIVSDNGPQFASQEFREYCEQRGITWTPTPPYHPNSNGEAERMVQTFKKGLKKGIKDGKHRTQAALDVLFQYRATQHPATGKSPAEMLMGRKLRTALTIIRSGENEPINEYREKMAENHRGKAKEREYKIGQEVYIRNYKDRGDKWLPGIVMEMTGANIYLIHFGTGSRWAHVDQIKPRVILWEDEDAWKEVSNKRKRKDATPQVPRAPVPRRGSRERKRTIPFQAGGGRPAKEARLVLWNGRMVSPQKIPQRRRDVDLWTEPGNLERGNQKQKEGNPSEAGIKEPIRRVGPRLRKVRRREKSEGNRRDSHTSSSEMNSWGGVMGMHSIGFRLDRSTGKDKKDSDGLNKDITNQGHAT